MQQGKVIDMPDLDFLKPTWHVYEDCTLKVFFKHQEMFALEMTPDQAIKMATDLIIAAQKLRQQKPA